MGFKPLAWMAALALGLAWPAWAQEAAMPASPPPAAKQAAPEPLLGATEGQEETPASPLPFSAPSEGDAGAGPEQGEIVVPPAEAPPSSSPASTPVPGAGQEGPAPSQAVENVIYYNTVRLQGLNKVTARVSEIEATIGSAARFGNLEIIARKCWQSPPEERPESAALLEVWEATPGEAPKQIFLGWMFASSPGLSALEHPVYDLTVLGCNRLAMKLE